MQNHLNSEGYDTDKGTSSYLDYYSSYFQQFINKDICLFELGIKRGGSLLMWRDYFKKGKIVGLDIEPVDLKQNADRVFIYQGLQQDQKILDKIRMETAEEGFDIIIDDASHIGELSRLSFWYLFDNHLKPGGIYVVEDWRTGYWDKWPDGHKYNMNRIDLFKGLRDSLDNMLNRVTTNTDSGKNKVIVRKVIRRIRDLLSQKRLKSHDYGMVGFIKQLIDELGMDMITSPDRGSKVPFRRNKFQKMEIFPGLVFIVKSQNGNIHRFSRK